MTQTARMKNRNRHWPGARWPADKRGELYRTVATRPRRFVYFGCLLVLGITCYHAGTAKLAGSCGEFRGTGKIASKFVRCGSKNQLRQTNCGKRVAAIQENPE